MQIVGGSTREVVSLSSLLPQFGLTECSQPLSKLVFGLLSSNFECAFCLSCFQKLAPKSARVQL